MLLGNDVLNIFSEFTGEHPCRSPISIKLQSNFIEIALQHGCSPVNLLHIFRTPFPKNTSEELLLHFLILNLNSSKVLVISHSFDRRFHIVGAIRESVLVFDLVV